jgi:DNA-binding response OmpR family regulator
MYDGSPEQNISVLYIEDDVELSTLIQRYLESHGLLVSCVANGRAGLLQAIAQRPDVVLLDLMLPGLSGVAVCKELRQRSDVPIIMVTARDEEADRVVGLEGGADDYIAKPFSSRELLARIRALLRRVRGASGPSGRQLVIDDLSIDPLAMSVQLGGQSVALTTYEFQLLHTLAESAGRPLSREQLIESVRGSAEEAFDRSIDVHISRLRHKLGDDPRNPQRLKTVRGIGYLLAKGSR